MIVLHLLILIISGLGFVNEKIDERIKVVVLKKLLMLVLDEINQKKMY
jgi:hypothetical protein